MSENPKCFKFLLILLFSFILGSFAKAVIKKTDLPKKGNSIAGERYVPEHQIFHAINSGANFQNANEARHKRSQLDLSSSEYRDFNDILDGLDDNTLAQSSPVQPIELDFENLPPLTYYLLLQKLRQLQSNEPTYRVRTPRLGRSIGFRHSDSIFGHDNDINDVTNIASDTMRQEKPFMTRLIKKSVPFKPRLGKRTQQEATLCE